MWLSGSASNCAQRLRWRVCVHCHCSEYASARLRCHLLRMPNCRVLLSFRLRFAHAPSPFLYNTHTHLILDATACLPCSTRLALRLAHSLAHSSGLSLSVVANQGLHCAGDPGDAAPEPRGWPAAAFGKRLIGHRMPASSGCIVRPVLPVFAALPGTLNSVLTRSGSVFCQDAPQLASVTSALVNVSSTVLVPPSSSSCPLVGLGWDHPFPSLITRASTLESRLPCCANRPITIESFLLYRPVCLSLCLRAGEHGPAGARFPGRRDADGVAHHHEQHPAARRGRALPPRIRFVPLPVASRLRPVFASLVRRPSHCFGRTSDRGCA